MAIRITNQNMNATVTQNGQKTGEQRMSAREIERLAGVRTGDAIVCTTGILWVTQEGDPEDYMLKQGEKFVANRHGVVVVQAMTEAACRFSRN